MVKGNLTEVVSIRVEAGTNAKVAKLQVYLKEYATVEASEILRQALKIGLDAMLKKHEKPGRARGEKMESKEVEKPSKSKTKKGAKTK